MTLIESERGYFSLQPTEHYYPAPVMIYGTYDDYGGMENCHGTETEFLLKEFIDKHLLDEDIDAHEYSRKGDAGGLYFTNPHTFNKALKGDKDPHIPVRHVVIKMSVLNRFLERYHFTDYHIKDDKDNYIPINYEYLCNLIPDYIEKLKLHRKAGVDDKFMLSMDPIPNPEWKDPDVLGKAISHFVKELGTDFYRQSSLKRLIALAEADDDEALTNFIKEFCKYFLIYSYMNYARRVYIRPVCSSQETDPKAQKLMAEITLEMVEHQRIEWEREDFPDDAWDEKRQVFMEQCELSF